MIGILIITHAPLANAFLSCARHVYGSDPQHCAVLDIPAKADPAMYLEEAKSLHALVDRGHGVLVLTDMFGATPTNIAVKLARPGRTVVLTGINLPMLLRTLTYRSSVPLEMLVEKASSGATAGVMRVASSAPQNQQKFTNPADPNAPAFDPSTDANTRMQHQQ